MIGVSADYIKVDIGLLSIGLAAYDRIVKVIAIATLKFPAKLKTASLFKSLFVIHNFENVKSQN